jgi:hypothetical protein
LGGVLSSPVLFKDKKVEKPSFFKGMKEFLKSIIVFLSVQVVRKA